MTHDEKNSNCDDNKDKKTDSYDIDYKGMVDKDHRILDYTKEEIQEYIDQIKSLVIKDKYIIPEGEKRAENDRFIEKYALKGKEISKILYSMNVNDFCYGTRNRNKGFEHEVLYVFSKEYMVTYLEGYEKIHIYIKMNLIKPNGRLVIIISFHEDTGPMKRLFERE